jgi:hypothetical protein
MKLDYLIDGSPDCPLIRLYDFTPSEARQFLTAVTGLASGAEKRVEVHRLPFVEAIKGCRLVLILRQWDQAIIRGGVPTEFECGFTAGTWDNIAGLIEPFAESAGGFQWLAGGPGEASLLLSESGQW